MFSKKVNDNNSKLNKDKAVKVKKSGKERALLIVKTVAIPLVFAAVVVVALYLAMQSKFEADSLKGDVLVMKEQVSANTKVTKADADKYFSKVSVELTAIPSTAYKSVNELPDAFYIEDAMAKNQMVVKANIATADYSHYFSFLSTKLHFRQNRFMIWYTNPHWQTFKRVNILGIYDFYVLISSNMIYLHIPFIGKPFHFFYYHSIL